jgi:hypothetical protein
MKNINNFKSYTSKRKFIEFISESKNIDVELGSDVIKVSMSSEADDDKRSDFTEFTDETVLKLNVPYIKGIITFTTKHYGETYYATIQPLNNNSFGKDDLFSWVVYAKTLEKLKVKLIEKISIYIADNNLEQDETIIESTIETISDEELFEKIITDMMVVTVNEKANWLDGNTVEWDIASEKNNSKLKDLLSKFTEEQVIKYFDKFINYISKLGKKTKSKILASAIGVFLLFTSVQNLTDSVSDDEIKAELVSYVKANLKKKVAKVEIEEVSKPVSFESAQELVKIGEGGYTDFKKDKGNWVDGKLIGTNHGISAPELKSHLGYTPSKQEMMDLTYDTALEIYKNKFWDRHNLSELNNQSIANIIYDGAINQGSTGMKKVVQRSLHQFDVDINLGNIYDSETMTIINNLDSEKFFHELYNQRISRYKESSDYDTFKDGWMNRLERFKYGK